MTKHSLRQIVRAAVLVLLATPAFAQERVTVIQRDGGKVTGQFEDWNHHTDVIYVRVSPTDQKIIPVKNVLVMDVGGDAMTLPASETEAARGEDHVLVTRGGEVLQGRLLNIEGGEGSSKPDEPRSVAFKADTERRMPLKEVARLYFGTYPAPTTTTAELPPGTFRLPANQQWLATTLVVRSGDRVQFTVKGEVQLSADAADKAAAAGSVTGRLAANAPATTLPAGAIIGRVGGGQPFGIGNQTEPLPMPAAGPLWIGINDDNVDDNRGEFIVSVRVIRASR